MKLAGVLVAPYLMDQAFLVNGRTLVVPPGMARQADQFYQGRLRSIDAVRGPDKEEKVCNDKQRTS